MNIKQGPYRFDAHEGSDCVMRYLQHLPWLSTTRETNEIVWGPVRYSVVMTWKQGGIEAYLQRLSDMGLLQ